MTKKREPWYVHAVLYVIIAILVYVLIRVAIVDPTDYMQKEAYYKSESRLRMNNIRQAEILWQKKKSTYTDNMDSLVNFVKTNEAVLALINGVDTLTMKSTNPFVSLKNGSFIPDSLMKSPKSNKPYILKVDTTHTIDTVVNLRGKIIRVDEKTVIGTIYFLECPDGYGTIGDLESQTRKNTSSWE